VSFFHNLFTHPAAWYHAHQLLVAQMGINSLLALSIWVTLYAGVLTLANVGFMAIGGYTTVIMAIHLHTPLALNIACGALLAAVVAAVIGLPVLRLRGVYLAIATIGFGEVVRFGFILNLGITGKGQGLTNPRADPNSLLPVWVGVALVTAVFWRLTASKSGRAWSAIREDELAAASGGVDTRAYKLSAFVIGAVVAGIAGGLDAHLNFFIDPTEYAFDRAILVLVFAFAGGILIAIGPVVGALTLTALPEIFRSAQAYRNVAYGAILIVIVVFRPQGIVGRGRRRRWPTTVPTDSAAATPKEPRAGPLLEVVGARRSFGGVHAVDGVDISIGWGEIVGLIGPNGAGKTTLTNLVTGFERLDSGSVRLMGEDVTGRLVHVLAKLGLARTFQTVRLYADLSVVENVLVGLDARRRMRGRRERVAAANALLRRVGLDPAEHGSALARTLSYGDQRRVEIARALALDPTLLLLDEPAAGMNPVEKDRLAELLRALVGTDGLSVLLIDHDLRLVMGLCDRVAVMDFGRKIADGPPAVVSEDPVVVAAYLGTRQVALPRERRSGSSRALLRVDELTVSYGGIQAVRGIDIRVDEGEIVTLIGANGAGKSSILRALSGLVPGKGAARFGDVDLLRAHSSQIVSSGLVHVAEGREILAHLTVEENLALGAWRRRDKSNVASDLDAQYRRFPLLGERRRLPAGQLSGGEQQMLAIARALMARPKLMLLDEPSLGLAPQLVEDVFRLIGDLAAEGITILLVEQNASRALELASRGYVVERGQVAIEGAAEDLLADSRVQAAYLGV
jgi:ABC-type branched-subunit amino acid transport system ATPase component/ABC-type branched-subunit amino acid transport system permease subunit